MAATDLLTAAEIKDVLEVSGSDHDTELAALITAVSGRIDDLCGPVVNRTITSELHSGGVHKIRPYFTPISSVTTLTEYVSTTSTTVTAETNSTKPADGYLLDGAGRYDRFIRRRSGGADALFASGRRNVEVTYVAGRVADTASVDELFKRAAALFITHLWKQSAPAWFTSQEFFDETPERQVSVPTFGVPNAVKHLLADEMRAPVVA